MPSGNEILLALETSGAHASAALFRGAACVSEREEKPGRALSERLIPMIHEVLREAGTEQSALNTLAVSAGPGSFTGLRVGLATAKGFAAAFPKLRLYAISTLDAIAFGCGAGGLVSVVIDARSGGLYCALYRCAGEGEKRSLETILPPAALAPEEWAKKLGVYGENISFAGDGARLCEEKFREMLGKNFALLPENDGIPRARWIGELARRKILLGEKPADPEALSPLYVTTREYAKVS
ncbi:MAG: tRNA (adenosine(37)-N6)-threonylcarbamoyltransferase complex dimerization subunit type 1 TsaB [Bdellovibrionota bacterium]